MVAGDRRVIARAMRTSHRAGLRGRHRHDDGRAAPSSRCKTDEAEAGEAFDPKANYLPAVAGYYSTAKGEMLSFPFNSSSTSVMFYNKDAFKKAGLNPDAAAQDLARGLRRQFAKKLKAAGHSCPLTTAWPTVDADRAVLAPGTTCRSPPRQNGMGGFDTEFKHQLAAARAPPQQTLADMQKDRACSTTPAAPTPARAASPRASARCSSRRRRSSARQRKANAKFDWSATSDALPRRTSEPARRRTRSSAAPPCG